MRGVDTVAQRAPHVAALAKGQGRPSHFPPKRKASRSPDRQASIERRRTAGGVRPHAAAARQPIHNGGAGGVAPVADEARAKRHCTLTLGELAARAGVGITTARNAIHEAAGHGYLTIEERRRDKRPNLSNVVRIVSREWLLWIERGRKNSSADRGNHKASASQGGGSKKMEPTDKGSKLTPIAETAFHAVNISKNLLPKAARSRLLGEG